VITPLFNLPLVRHRHSKVDRSEIESYVAEVLTERLDFIARDFHTPVHLGHEDLPLNHPDQSADLVTSSLTLHWVTDLPGFLAEIHRILIPDGLFMAALIGGDSLWELRESLAQAELDLRGGVSPRVSPMISVKDAGALLQRAGFALPVADVERKMILYPSPQRLLTDLKSMGETNALVARDPGFPPRALFAKCFEIYADRFATPEGYLPLTLEVIYLSGWRPHPSQQQPLLPGSGKVSLLSALK
jgi:NADH dehydrogenase [ubiquinone] 1 alpha subcomplex assembly factor 5